MTTVRTNQKAKPFAQFIVAFFGMFFASLVFAQAGGLNEATDTMEEIKDWAYIFLGTGVFLFVMYNIVMALLDRKQWSEVLMAVCYTALAGAALVITAWAWSIWGS